MTETNSEGPREAIEAACAAYIYPDAWPITRACDDREPGTGAPLGPEDVMDEIRARVGDILRAALPHLLPKDMDAAYEAGVEDGRAELDETRAEIAKLTERLVDLEGDLGEAKQEHARLLKKHYALILALHALDRHRPVVADCCAAFHGTGRAA